MRDMEGEGAGSSDGGTYQSINLVQKRKEKKYGGGKILKMKTFKSQRLLEREGGASDGS